jgi:hypothetical protein
MPVTSEPVFCGPKTNAANINVKASGTKKKHQDRGSVPRAKAHYSKKRIAENKF